MSSSSRRSGSSEGSDDRRGFPDGGRHVGEEAADVVEGLLFAVHFVVDGAAAVGVDVGAAELLLLDLAAEGSVHDRGAGDEELARSAHHHGEVGRRDAGRAQPGDGAQGGRDDGHERKQLDRDVPIGIRRHIRSLERGVRPDAAAAAGAVDETDERQPQLSGGAFAPAHLVADGAIGRAAAHGEVVGADDDGPAIDRAAPGDEVRRGEGLYPALFVVFNLACQRADLAERAVVQQLVDAVADGSAALGDVAGDAFGAAHFLGEFAPAADLLEFGFPGHSMERLWNALTGRHYATTVHPLTLPTQHTRGAPRNMIGGGDDDEQIAMDEDFSGVSGWARPGRGNRGGDRRFGRNRRAVWAVGFAGGDPGCEHERMGRSARPPVGRSAGPCGEARRAGIAGGGRRTRSR